MVCKNARENRKVFYFSFPSLKIFIKCCNSIILPESRPTSSLAIDSENSLLQNFINSHDEETNETRWEDEDNGNAKKASKGRRATTHYSGGTKLI